MITYCTYLTIYSGNKLPPFYIGFSTTKKIERGYRGSVSSADYRTLWKNELQKHSEETKLKAKMHWIKNNPMHDPTAKAKWKKSRGFV